jgi:DNA-binding transcriptional LysR family regulator
MFDGMTLDQLRAFVAVAETGSFSAAARRLGRVHSAISQSVATLEDQLGVLLFERGGRTPALSRAGTVLLPDAWRVLGEARALKARAAAMDPGIEDELTVAVDGYFPAVVLMEAVTAFRDAFPLLPVSIFTEGLGGAEQRLRDGVVGLAVYALALTGARDLESAFLTEVAMLPVVAPGHPLAAIDEPVTLDMLQPHIQLVLTDRTPLTHNTSGGVLGSRIWRFADLATRLQYLLAGFGWCFMPEHVVRADLAAGRLVRLDLASIGPTRLALSAVWERGRSPGRAGRWLLEDLQQRLASGGA